MKIMKEYKDYKDMTPREFFEATMHDEPYEFMMKCQLRYRESKKK